MHLIRRLKFEAFLKETSYYIQIRLYQILSTTKLSCSIFMSVTLLKINNIRSFLVFELIELNYIAIVRLMNAFKMIIYHPAPKYMSEHTHISNIREYYTLSHIPDKPLITRCKTIKTDHQKRTSKQTIKAHHQAI